MSVNKFCLFAIAFISLWCMCFTVPAAPSANDDTAIRTELVDGNNRKQILAMFNLTEAQMSRIYADINAANKESEANGSIYFQNLRDFRINDIRTRINNAINTKTSEEIPEHPLHEMAAYPTCNSETTESSWQQDNNITIQFSSTLFEQKMQNLNLDSAILRLYKINPNQTLDDANPDDEIINQRADTLKPKRCTTPQLDAQIRVTVSIVQQLRRNKRGVYERKKRICNTIMMNVSSTGWVEIDIRRAIYIWENVGKQLEQQQQQQTRPPVLVGWLMIEVHDEEEQPLKPGLFFKPPSCNQADLAIPWNYYRPYPSMSPFATHEVPRFPRLDVKLIGYASFAPINMPNAQPDNVYASLKNKLFNLAQQPSSSSSEIDNESTTQIAATADNHLDEIEGSLQQRFQQKRHLKLQHVPEIQSDNSDDKQTEADEDIATDNIEYNYRNHPRNNRHHSEQGRQQQPHTHYHQHHVHQPQHDMAGMDDDDDGSAADIIKDESETEDAASHRLFKHHHQNHHHHHHHQQQQQSAEVVDVLEKNIEQQQHETKLLEHIVHKLEQEEQQLLLLHQQQQEEQQQQQQQQEQEQEQ